MTMRGHDVKQSLQILLVALVLGGCAGTIRDIRQAFDGREAVLPQSMLGAVPCVTDAIRTTFGVVPVREGSYAEPQMAGQSYVKQVLVVPLDPGGTATGARTDRHIRYEIRALRDGRAAVVYNVDFEGALRDEWMEQAFGPLSMCGAQPVAGK